MRYLKLSLIIVGLGALVISGGCGGGGSSSLPAFSPDDYTPAGPFGPYQEILGAGGPEKASIFAGPTDVPGEISKRASLPVVPVGGPGLNEVVDNNGLLAYQLRVNPGKTWHVVKVWPRLQDAQGVTDRGDPDLYVASVTHNYQIVGASLRWGKLVDWVAWRPNNGGNHVALVHGYPPNPAGYLIEADTATYIPVNGGWVGFLGEEAKEDNKWFSFEGLEGNNLYRIHFQVSFDNGETWRYVDLEANNPPLFHAWVYYMDSHGFVDAAGYHRRELLRPYDPTSNPNDRFTVDWHGKRASWHFLHIHCTGIPARFRVQIKTYPFIEAVAAGGAAGGA